MGLGLPDLSKFDKRFDVTEELQREMLAELRVTNRLLADLIYLQLPAGIHTSALSILETVRAEVDNSGR